MTSRREPSDIRMAPWKQLLLLIFTLQDRLNVFLLSHPFKDCLSAGETWAGVPASWQRCGQATGWVRCGHGGFIGCSFIYLRAYWALSRRKFAQSPPAAAPPDFSPGVRPVSWLKLPMSLKHSFTLNPEGGLGKAENSLIGLFSCSF